MNIENITNKGITLDRNGQSMQRELYEREIYNLQTRWNNLKKWLDRQREGYQHARIDIPEVLDKMNELEGKDK